MTVEQALNMIDPQRLLVLGRQVIFNTWDEEEAHYWSAQGANVRPFYSEQAVRFHNKVKQGWEVEMSGACERVKRTRLTGEEEDVTRDMLVAEAHKRKQAA